MNKAKVISVLSIVFAVFTLFGVTGYYNGRDLVNRVPFMSMISHTEYAAGQSGQIITRLVDYQDSPVVVNYCKVWILNPDKTAYVEAALMTDDSGNFSGNHFYNFTAPSVGGVYEYISECNFNKTPSQTISKKVSNSFHLNPALSDIYAVNSSLSNLILTTSGNATAQLAAVGVNVSLVYSDTQWLRGHALDVDGNFTALFTRLDGVDANLSELENYCGSSVTNSSPLCSVVYELNANVLALNATMNGAQLAYLQEINATTHSVYDYLTGALSTKVDDVMNVLLGMGGTVNATYNLAVVVNSTTQTILQNQQDDYRMSIYSG